MITGTFLTLRKSKAFKFKAKVGVLFCFLPLFLFHSSSNFSCADTCAYCFLPCISSDRCLTLSKTPQDRKSKRSSELLAHVSVCSHLPFNASEAVPHRTPLTADVNSSPRGSLTSLQCHYHKRFRSTIVTCHRKATWQCDCSFDCGYFKSFKNHLCLATRTRHAVRSSFWNTSRTGLWWRGWRIKKTTTLIQSGLSNCCHHSRFYSRNCLNLTLPFSSHTIKATHQLSTAASPT